MMLACTPFWVTAIKILVPATLGAWLFGRQMQRDVHKGD